MMPNSLALNEHPLQQLLNPRSVVVIGASDKPAKVGTVVYQNLLNHFSGIVYAVNPKYQQLQGRSCYASVEEIPEPVDLAVILTPAATVPAILAACAKQSIRRAIIISAGFGETESGKHLQQQLIALASKEDVRFIGPNCLGVMRPSCGLNATFESSPMLAGNVAFISQSGALCAAVLDWAGSEGIGFSTMISMGNSIDIDFGQVIEYLADDPQTDYILLYIEGIHDAASFLQGITKAAARKPVIAIKAGRNAKGSQAALSHTGAMVVADDIFDAALSRAGVIRVASIEALFAALRIFSAGRYVAGDGCMIITNGGGAGVMAADRASDLQVMLPNLSTENMQLLQQAIPYDNASRNPLDILGDATPERYRKALEGCISDPHCHAVIVILVPVAMAEPFKVAQEVVAFSKSTTKPIIACWMGQEQVQTSRDYFIKHQIPHFATPELAVEALSFLYRFRQQQSTFSAVNQVVAEEIHYDLPAVRLVIDQALREGRNVLTTIESKAILTAFGIPVTSMHIATSAAEAAAIADSIGYPVVMKIHSPDITHKQDVHGVQLNITSPQAVADNFTQMVTQVAAQLPEAKILGVTIEPMYKTPQDRELLIGILRDAVLGPTIHFGAGGSMVEVIQDRAIELPPLNPFLVQRLIQKTRIARMLDTFRDKPAINHQALEELLLRVSSMACHVPAIQEMDINPLIVNDKGVLALDARFVVKRV